MSLTFAICIWCFFSHSSYYFPNHSVFSKYVKTQICIPHLQPSICVIINIPVLQEVLVNRRKQFYHLNIHEVWPVLLFVSHMCIRQLHKGIVLSTVPSSVNWWYHCTKHSITGLSALLWSISNVHWQYFWCLQLYIHPQIMEAVR